MSSKLLRAIETAAYVLIIAQISACATTTINSSWKDPSYQVKPHKIMIIGIARRPANKRTLEDEFVRQIKVLGTDAVSSYAILPDDKDRNKDVIAAKMKELGADAVLITRIAQRKTVYTNELDLYAPPLYYGTWQNYYGYGFDDMYSPGYVEETKYAVMETNMYDAGNDKLVFSASSETEVSGTDQKSIKSYVAVIVQNMVKQKLLMNK
jgi:hypothetical protein